MMDCTTAPENSESPSVTRRRGRTNRRTSSRNNSDAAANERMIVGPRMTRGASSMAQRPSANAGHVQPFTPVGLGFVDGGLAAQLQYFLGGGGCEDMH